MMMKNSDAAIALVVFSLCVSICSSTYAMNHTCSPPISQGGTGYCGPSFCETSASSAVACVFTSSVINYQTKVSQIPNKSCVQSTDARCTSAALAAVILGHGIKTAYCNDAFLVIVSDGTPGFTTNLLSVKNPPGAVSSDGTLCVTRTVNPSYEVVKIPLFPTLLSTSDKDVNNINTKSFPGGPGDADGTYMSTTVRNTAATYGLPTRGAIGVSIAGQQIFPVFNNLATLAPQKCEVDTCNEHVGGGGGQPHLHGDPFGSWCLYSALNYSSSTVHPPQIGWAFDGPSIYGRYLSVQNAGYSYTLDDCGGHTHGTYGYHYHAQVLTSLTDSGSVNGQASGQTYYASTTGPYKCLKGDISLITNYYGNLITSYTSVLPDTTTYMCSGTTNYYSGSGIVVPNTVSVSSAAPTVVPSVAPSAPSSKPTPIPSFAPTTATPSFAPTTAIPSFMPTAIPTFAPTTAIPSSMPTAIPTFAPTTAIPSSMPTAIPTFAPTTATPSASPTTATPSYAPTLPFTTYVISEVVTSIALNTTAKISAFSSLFKTVTASILSIDESYITITSVTSTTRRRLGEDEGTLEMYQYRNRPYLQITGGVVVVYTVSARSALNTITTTLQSASSVLIVNAALSSRYPGATVSTITVDTPSPSRSPVSSSCRINLNIIFSVSLVTMTLLFHTF